MSTAAVPIRRYSTTISDLWASQSLEFPGQWYKYSVTGEYHTVPPAVVRFEHDLARFQRALGSERDAARCMIVKRIRTADRPIEFIQTTVRTLVSSARPGRLDDAVDILSQCGELLPTFIFEVLSQPQAAGIDEDYWYVLIRAVGKSTLPSASIFVEMLSPNSPEAAVEALGDIGSEQALKRLRAVAAHGPSPFIRQLAAGIIDECSE